MCCVDLSCRMGSISPVQDYSQVAQHLWWWWWWWGWGLALGSVGRLAAWPQTLSCDPVVWTEMSYGPSRDSSLSFPLYWSEFCHMTLPKQITDSPKSPLKLGQGHLP